jgi:hypothetical protein
MRMMMYVMVMSVVAVMRVRLCNRITCQGEHDHSAEKELFHDTGVYLSERIYITIRYYMCSKKIAFWATFIKALRIEP